MVVPRTVNSIALCVFENAAGFGEAFPGLPVALGAEPRRKDGILGLKAAMIALQAENRHPAGNLSKWIVGRELAFRSEMVHADAHAKLLHIQNLRNPNITGYPVWQMMYQRTQVLVYGEKSLIFARIR
jgi:hypothetical protein